MKILIQLVSDQSMPNLLATMALKPDKIIHCCTDHMVGRHEHLQRAYRTAGLKIPVTVASLSPRAGIGEVNRLVRRIIDENPTVRCVMNFTGGTKLMAIGGFSAAMQEHMDSIYVDTHNGMFLDGGTGKGVGDLFPDGDMSLAQVTRQLRVDTVAVSNGCERVTNGATWKPLVPFVTHLLHDPALEQKCHNVADGLLKDLKRRRAGRNQSNTLILENPLPLTMDFAKTGIRAHIFERRNGSIYLSPESPIGDALDALTFLQGCWWEVAVMNHLNEQGLFRDLRWSVDVGARENSTDMEEDIVGIDGVNLLYVSCKRGGYRAGLSRILEEVDASARRIGGSHSHKILAVYLPLTGTHGQRLLRRAKELRIEILSQNEVRNDR
ncbi:MAG: DUF1887 family protein [Spartobacteria bacterium]|nr:DUF1887 family protein [Spartobacteria bacterium]